MARKQQGKTHFMHLIEARHAGQTIEALMINAFRTHGNERGAASALGITQQTFNSWKYRLGLADHVARRGHPPQQALDRGTQQNEPQQR